MAAVQAISFDLWDTVFVDDSDEPKRKAAGLPSKKVARRNLVQQFVEESGSIDRALVDCAYDAADAAFRTVWHDQFFTWTVTQRLQIVLAGLHRELSADRFAELVRCHEDMELEVQPDLATGIAEAMAELASRYTLVVISDAIFSPGRALRQLLEHYQLLQHFKGFVFSDELGCSKPEPRVFHEAAKLAGCSLDALVHLGDREHNDIDGAHRVGARAVLVTYAIDRGSDGSQADAICGDARELPATIARLDKR
ncbi:MAG: HAD family hydrolase [Pseudomonadota bacterium]